MARKITVTAERERLDTIAATALGSEREGGVEALLAANPGLAAGGAFAAFGTALRLPKTVIRPADPQPTRPWE